MRERDTWLEGQQDDVLDLGRLFQDVRKGLKKFWWLVLVLAVAGSGVFCCYRAVAYKPLYESSASFTVKTLSGTSQNDTSTTYNFTYNKSTAAQLGNTFPYILTSDVLQQELEEELGTDEINGIITASSVEDSNLFTLTVSSASQKDAKEILEAVMKVYPDVSQYVIGETQFQVVEEAKVSEKPVNFPDYKKTFFLGAVVGILAAMLFIIFYALSRKTVRQADDLKEILNITCLATLPEVSRQNRRTRADGGVNIYAAQKDTMFVERIRSLQNRVENYMLQNNQKVLLVTSTEPMEGKSTISMNLALAMAQTGKKVVLMDGDLRKPELKARLRLKNYNVQIKDVLKGRISLGKAVCYLKKERLYFLGNCKPLSNPSAAIGSPAMSKMMEKLRRNADVIIIDVPPCDMMADTAQYWSYADGVLYVVRQDWVDIKRIAGAIQDLPENGSKLIGCVLNRAKDGEISYGYKYGYYGYYGKKK